MGAQPARDDYAQSHSGSTQSLGGADVISMARRRPSPYPRPDQNHPKPAQTVTPNSGANSAPRITVRDAYGAVVDDLASVRSVWTDSPDPLCKLVADATAAVSGDATAKESALAAWAVLVLVPRATIHLTSWILTHPLRTLALTVALIITYLTA